MELANKVDFIRAELPFGVVELRLAESEVTSLARLPHLEFEVTNVATAEKVAVWAFLELTADVRGLAKNLTNSIVRETIFNTVEKLFNGECSAELDEFAVRAAVRTVSRNSKSGNINLDDDGRIESGYACTNNASVFFCLTGDSSARESMLNGFSEDYDPAKNAIVGRIRIDDRGFEVYVHLSPAFSSKNFLYRLTEEALTELAIDLTKASVFSVNPAFAVEHVLLAVENSGNGRYADVNTALFREDRAK